MRGSAKSNATKFSDKSDMMDLIDPKEAKLAEVIDMDVTDAPLDTLYCGTAGIILDDQVPPAPPPNC
jgi:hypothetical protein